MSAIFILLRRSLTIKWKRQLTYCFTKNKAFSTFIHVNFYKGRVRKIQST